VLVARIADRDPRVHAVPTVHGSIPVFGVRNDTLPQKTRACAYAVITNPDGLIAAVEEHPGKLFLPGGGIEPAETPAEAVDRELLEELGCQVHLTTCIGHALQYITSKDYCQATYAAFFVAELGEKIRASHEHELRWAPAERLHLAYQSWAAQNCLRGAGNQTRCLDPTATNDSSTKLDGL
jgi:8-oxo-dGTP pyrophosphatase MutT (NUDIX family)